SGLPLREVRLSHGQTSRRLRPFAPTYRQANQGIAIQRENKMLSRTTQTLVLVSILAICGPACASMLPYNDTVLVTGPEYLAKFDLPVDGAGRYQVTATDLKYLNKALDTLWFGVFTATQPLATRQGAGTLEFFLSSASEKVSLQIYAKPAAGLSAG